MQSEHTITPNDTGSVLPISAVMKHTAVPWYIIGEDKFGNAVGISISHGGGVGVNVIAFLWCDGGDDIKQEQQQNAKLIVVSPKLYELAKVISQLDEYSPDPKVVDAINTAKTVLLEMQNLPDVEFTDG